MNLVVPGPRIEEGDNVYIPVGTSLDVYDAELPADAQRQMKQIFDDSYINNPKGLPGSPDWWQEEEFKRKPSPFVDHAFSPSSDALWQRPKYSRTVDAIDFNSQEGARIGAINRRAYNFFQPSTKKGKQAALGFANSARIDRETMPFFVMVELNDALVGGKICWRGQALVEGDGGKFSLVDHPDRACRRSRSKTKASASSRSLLRATSRSLLRSIPTSNIGLPSGSEMPRAPSARLSFCLPWSGLKEGVGFSFPWAPCSRRSPSP